MRKSMRTWLATLLGCFLLASAIAVPACSLREVMKEPVAEGIKETVGEEISKKLPVESQAAFDERWATGDVKGALTVAGEAIGAEKLADLIEKAKAENEQLRAQNAELAADIRARGTEAVKERWLSILIALSGATGGGILGAVGLKRGSLWYRIGATVIGGVQAFLKAGPEGNAELMANIKAEAIANGSKAELDAAVGKVLKAKGEKPIVGVGVAPAPA